MLIAAALWAIAPVQEAAPRIVTVRTRGLLFTDNQAGVSGVDAGYSIPVGQRVLWLFGDVFLQHPTDPDRRWVGGHSNAALVTPRGRGLEPLRRGRFVTDPATGIAVQVIPNRPGEGVETRLWPLAGWHDAANRRIYLFWSRIRTTGSGPLDFRLEGNGLAQADAGDLDRVRFERLPSPEGGDVWWPPDGPVMGAALAEDRRAGWLWVIGERQRAGRKEAVIARVRPDRIADRSAYEYYAGPPEAPRWSSSPADAAPIEGLGDFSEASLSWNAYLGGWLVTHSVGIEERVRLSLAAAPWGPYRPIGEIGARHQAFARAFSYAGKEHPHMAEQGGRVVYVTFVDSNRYWLHLLEVTLAR
ncbi:MAG TPA: DUF4185 domain-containing protein [Chthonomonadales bacterium]|nr:DUF4185 domain-containing protein [Chthonomonadales bacterium]